MGDASNFQSWCVCLYSAVDTLVSGWAADAVIIGAGTWYGTLIEILEPVQFGAAIFFSFYFVAINSRMGRRRRMTTRRPGKTTIQSNEVSLHLQQKTELLSKDSRFTTWALIVGPRRTRFCTFTVIHHPRPRDTTGIPSICI